MRKKNTTEVVEEKAQSRCPSPLATNSGRVGLSHRITDPQPAEGELGPAPNVQPLQYPADPMEACSSRVQISSQSPNLPIPP